MAIFHFDASSPIRQFKSQVLRLTTSRARQPVPPLERRYLAGNPPVPGSVIFRLVKADAVIAVAAHDVADVGHVIDEAPQRSLVRRGGSTQEMARCVGCDSAHVRPI